MSEKIRCKVLVLSPEAYRPTRCSSFAIKDCYCIQHHPDTVRKERQKTWEQRQAFSPYAQIEKLKKQRDKLLEALKNLADAADEGRVTYRDIDDARAAIAKAKGAA